MIQQQSNFSNPLPSGWQGSNNVNYPPFALIEGSETWSHAIVTNIKRLGTSSWRMEVRPGDRTVYYGSYRAEITGTSKGNVNTYKATAYRLSTYVPSGTWASTSEEAIFPFQFHPWASGNNGGSPSLAVEIKNDRYRMVVRHTNGSTSGSQVMLTFDIGPVERDVFVDWIVYYQPHITNGRIIIWRRVLGVDSDYRIAPNCNYTGPCLHAWSQFPFFKMGVYWWKRPGSGGPELIHRGYIDESAFGQSTPENIVNEFRIQDNTPPPNQGPLCNAGPDQSLAAGLVSTMLVGSSSDPDGTVVSHLWEIVAGGNATLSGANTPTLTVNDMEPGQYSFRYTVTDDKGAKASDTVNVIVTAMPVNQPPTVSAGPDQALPENVFVATLDGEGSDPEGGELTPLWQQVDGPNQAVFDNTGAWNPVASNLIAGEYLFRLMVTDNKGLTASDDVVVAVPEIPVPDPKVQFEFSDIDGKKTVQCYDNGTWLLIMKP